MVSFAPQSRCPGETAPASHWVGGWVAPRTDLNSTKIKFAGQLFSVRPSIPNSVEILSALSDIKMRTEKQILPLCVRVRSHWPNWKTVFPLCTNIFMFQQVLNTAKFYTKLLHVIFCPCILSLFLALKRQFAEVIFWKSAQASLKMSLHRTSFSGRLTLVENHDSSVGIELRYGLDDWGSRVRFPAGAGNVSLHHRFQNGSGAHPASYPMGTRDSLLGVKRPEHKADYSPPSSAEVKEWVELYLYSPIRLHSVVLS
jgi:hypothetical protein